MFCSGAPWVLFRTPQHPSHYDPLHSSSFYLKKDHRRYGASQLCMLHTRWCGTPCTHKAPTIQLYYPKNSPLRLSFPYDLSPYLFRYRVCPLTRPARRTSPVIPPLYLYLLPGMPLTPRADKVPHSVCFLWRYLYIFTTHTWSWTPTSDIHSKVYP
jgi:hypothetical protein